MNEKNTLIIEGLKDCLELLEKKSGIIEKVLWAEKYIKLQDLENIQKLTKKNNVLLEKVNLKIFYKLKKTKTTQGFIALIKKPQHTLKDLKKTSSIVVLDSVQDPGNVGTIIRSACVLGFDAVVLTKGSVRLDNQKLLRSIKGYITDIMIFEDIEIMEMMDFLQMNSINLYAADMKGIDIISSKLLIKKPLAIFFGSEGRGLSQKVLEKAKLISIKMCRNGQSLNVAVSAGIILFEAGKKWIQKRN
ncbi:TrmH family RNA methyltransferase [bacterium]